MRLDDDDDDDHGPPQRVVGEGTLATRRRVVSRNPNGVVMWRDELAAWLPARAEAARRLAGGVVGAAGGGQQRRRGRRGCG